MEMGSAGSAFLKMARRSRVRHKPCGGEDSSAEETVGCDAKAHNGGREQRRSLTMRMATKQASVVFQSPLAVADAFPTSIL